jgi:2-aminoadipate transaminase
MQAKLSDLGMRQRPSDITRLMTFALEQPNMLSLAAGFTDNESLPIEDVREIVEEIADSGAMGKTTLQYGANKGRDRLRSLLAKRIRSFDTIDESHLDEKNLFISNGSQQALYLAIQTLCDPGDFVLVEQPTYFVFLEILQGFGVNALAMPMREDGEIDLAGLERLLSQFESEGNLDKVKALYLVSYFSNPSGHCVSEKVKSDIGSLLSRQKEPIAVIEDAAYRELYYENPFDSRSGLALESFNHLPVLYTSTLTKPYASGLKVGYSYCSDTNWLNSMLNVKGQQDFGTANFAQAIVEHALASGRFDAHLNSLRGLYKSKMLTLHESLGESLKSLGWKWEEPAGGLYLWLKSPNGMRTDGESPFHSSCIENGVFYVPGNLCFPGNEDRSRIRLSFGSLNLEDIREAALRFVAAAASMTDSAIA